MQRGEEHHVVETPTGSDTSQSWTESGGHPAQAGNVVSPL